MLDGLYSYYSSYLIDNKHVSEEWNLEAEKLFALLDEDKKGHLEAESIQFWVLTLLAPEVNCLEPTLFRKQTSTFLQEMQHTNGLVSMRGWKNYLLNKNWTDPLTLKLMSENFLKTLSYWKQIRATVFSSESLATYNYLSSSTENLPSIWNQCIISCVSSNNIKSNNEKLAIYLRFVGLQLGSTPTLSTKGVVYIKGTHIRDIPEFSVFIMANYLQFSGQYNTSASISSLTQQAIDTLSSDPRFKAIRKTLQTYDNLLNIIMYELISSFPKVAKIQTPTKSVMKLQYSSTTSILSGKTTRSVTPTRNTTMRGVNSTPERKEKPVMSALSSFKFSEKDIKNMRNLTLGLTEDLKNKGTEVKRVNKSPIRTEPKKNISFVTRKIDTRSEFNTSQSRKNDYNKTQTNLKNYSKSPARRIDTKTNASTIGKSTKSISPMRGGDKETYEQVMRRLIQK